MSLQHGFGNTDPGAGYCRLLASVVPVSVDFGDSRGSALVAMSADLLMYRRESTPAPASLSADWEALQLNADMPDRQTELADGKLARFVGEAGEGVISI